MTAAHPRRRMGRRPSATVAIGLLAVGALGLINLRWGESVVAALLALISVLAVAWQAGALPALVLATLVGAFRLWELRSAGPVPPLELLELAMRLALYSALATLLARARVLYARLRSQAQCDPLTSLLSGQVYLAQVAAELNRSRRAAEPVTLVFLDCDGFKDVNDTLGHLVGDQVLKAVAGALRENVREYDLVSRWGGDEFSVLLPETGPEEAVAVVTRLHAALVDAVQRQGWPITFSIGVVTTEPSQPSPEGAEDLLRRADQAMYAAKRAGRNRIEFAPGTAAPLEAPAGCAPPA